MKLERVPEYLTVTVTVIVGLIFAVLAGRYTGSGQANLIATMLLMGMAATLVMTMRERLWFLIPLFWPLAGRITVLPLPFALRDLVILFTFSAFLALIALKVVRQKPTYASVDRWLLLLLFLLAAALIRNPVGTQAMGSDRVGGKPYFDVFVATLAYYVLTRSWLPTTWAWHIPYLFSVGAWFQGIVGFITFKFPGTVPIIQPFYSGINTDAYNSQNIASETNFVEDRQTHLAFFGSTTFLILLSYFRSITLLIPLYLPRFLFMLLGAFAALKSGHRSLILGIGLLFLAASYFRNGFREVVRLLALGVPVIVMLVLLQGNVVELPKSVQRSLSFLPGKWDANAVDDARGSTEWRLLMWREALTTDRYIDNKILGDGFGYSRREYEGMLRAADITGGGQENAMISGAFHSGPVSTIRVVGWIGLALFMAMIILMARMAARLIRRSEGTSYYIPALFIGLPIFIEPFEFVFIFGAFDGSFPQAIIDLGLLKLLQNSLDRVEPAKPLGALDAQRVAPPRRRPQRMVEPVYPATPARRRPA